MFFLAPLYRLFKDINEERIDIRNLLSANANLPIKLILLLLFGHNSA